MAAAAGPAGAPKEAAGHRSARTLPDGGAGGLAGALLAGAGLPSGRREH